MKWYFIGAVLAGAAFGFSGWALPKVMKEVIPALLKGGQVPWHELLPVASLLPLVFLVRAVGMYANTYLINYCGIRVLESIQLLVYDHLQQLPLSFFQKHKSGDLLSRLTGDTQQMRVAIVDIANDIMIQPMMLIGAFSYIVIEAFQSSEFSVMLVCLATVPLCVLPIRAFGRKLRKKAEVLQAQTGDVTALATDTLQAPQEIRSYNMQKSVLAEFKEQIMRMFKARMKVVKYDKLISPSIEVVTALGLTATIIYAGRAGMNFENDLAPLLAALYLCYDPIKKLGKVQAKIQRASASLDRVEYLLHFENDLPDPERPLEFSSAQGQVSFSGINFSYDETPVLQDVNIDVPAGQVVALVGPSGAGKSTFVSLLPRFYDASDGSLCIDGKDVRAVEKHALREQISLVSQTPVLFNKSVMDNIRIGKPDASDAEVIAAARQAHAHDFIQDTLDDGYNTAVGEKGNLLSGGQRQRIAIARAFLKDAPILILDEATSALDSESESIIQTALEALVKGRTTFIIAHRFSTIKIADRILVFNQGHIVADGPHEQIYHENNLYRDLYNLQQGDSA